MVVWAHAYGSSVDDGNDHEFDNDCPCDYNYVAVHYSHDDNWYFDDYLLFGLIAGLSDSISMSANRLAKYHLKLGSVHSRVH